MGLLSVQSEARDTALRARSAYVGLGCPRAESCRSRCYEGRAPQRRGPQYVLATYSVHLSDVKAPSRLALARLEAWTGHRAAKSQPSSVRCATADNVLYQYERDSRWSRVLVSIPPPAMDPLPWNPLPIGRFWGIGNSGGDGGRYCRRHGEVFEGFAASDDDGFDVVEVCEVVVACDEWELVGGCCCGDEGACGGELLVAAASGVGYESAVVRCDVGVDG